VSSRPAARTPVGDRQALSPSGSPTSLTTGQSAPRLARDRTLTRTAGYALSVGGPCRGVCRRAAWHGSMGAREAQSRASCPRGAAWRASRRPYNSRTCPRGALCKARHDRHENGLRCELNEGPGGHEDAAGEKSAHCDLRHARNGAAEVRASRRSQCRVSRLLCAPSTALPLAVKSGRHADMTASGV
jgi:hypothetical protein